MCARLNCSFSYVTFNQNKWGQNFIIRPFEFKLIRILRYARQTNVSLINALRSQLVVCDGKHEHVCMCV